MSASHSSALRTTAMLSLPALDATWKRRALSEPAPPGDVPIGARPLLEHWHRSRELGVDPEGDHALEHAIVASEDVRAACERTEPIWRHARVILEDFAQTCAQRDFVTLLSDKDGIIAHAAGGGGFADEARRLRLIEGAAWSEATRGTNAIGTALAAGCALAVHGNAHYARVYEGVVCYAAPIRDPYGQIVGVLDATSYEERAAHLDPSVVLTVARAIEEVLRAQSYGRTPGGLRLVERLIERAAGAAFLVENPSRLVRTNAEARALLSRSASGRVLPEWDDLIEIASRSGHAQCLLRDLGEEAELTVEPILESDGHLLALLVFVTPAPRAKRGGRARSPFESILGDDPALLAAERQCARLARSRLPILLLADTGTGKELFARAVHESSARADGPYVALNCGAIQPELLLSELFGHAPGAFTGASAEGREGLVAAADGGTVFLDEVADLSIDAQVALLRVLEDGSYTRVGESAPRRADIRIVAATCRDLRQLVEAGRFREDLYFRIGGACVELPPLRQRTDFEELVAALWERQREQHGPRLPRLGDELVALLARHDWPGNVRELESALEYAAVMAEGRSEVLAEHLPNTLRHAPAKAPEAAAEPTGAMDAARRTSLIRALEVAGGNISAAARQLGVARSTVYRLMERYGLQTD